MARPTKTDAVNVRRSILDSALEEFSRLGYDRATLDNITAHAGVSKGAAYWYFESKRALFLAVLQREMSRFGERAQAAIGGEDVSVVERLERLIKGALTYYVEHPQFVGLIKILAFPGSPGVGPEGEVERMARDEYRRIRMPVEALLQEGVKRGELDPERTEYAAPMLVALLDSLMFQWLIDGEAIPLPEAAAQIARAYLHGVVKGGK